MKYLRWFGLALALMLPVAGCARNYNIYTNSGRIITSRGKPHYDKANSMFTYTDMHGDKSSIAVGTVRQIEPASDKSNPASFNVKSAH
jgi:hypothetical protein